MIAFGCTLPCHASYRPLVRRLSSEAPDHMTSRCLITGAAGFIGSRLCQQLGRTGEWTIAPVARRIPERHSSGIGGSPWLYADLLNRVQTQQVLQGVSHVVHLAHGHRGTLLTKQLVDCAIQQRVERFVHISTMSVHGPAPGPEAACEDTATIGRYHQEYCDSKAEQEEIVRAAVDRGDLRAVILRPTVVYGPNSHFVEQIVHQAQTGTVTRFDGGVGLCNAVFVDDVCEAIGAALTSERALGEAMFINGDRAVTWAEFIAAFASLVEPAPVIKDLSSAEVRQYWQHNPPQTVHSLGQRISNKLLRLIGAYRPPPPAPWPPLGRVERESIRITFRNDKAKRLLGWAPRVDFSQGVELTRTWFRNARTAQ